MERYQVKSGNIKSIGYENKILQIEFKRTGAVYNYVKVPYAVYNNLMHSESKGSFFQEKIKDKYRAEKVKT